MATELTPKAIYDAERDGWRAGLDGHGANPYPPGELFDAWECGYKHGLDERAKMLSPYDRSWARVKP